MNNDTSFQPNLGNIDSTTNEKEEVVETVISTPVVGTDSHFNSFTCDNCHMTFSTNNASATSCIYCGSRVSAVEGQSFEGYQVIPFSESIDDAYAAYKKKCRFNPIIPFSFRKKGIKNRIRKVYVPCTLSNVEVDGAVNFFGADKISNVKNAPMQTFESQYTTHFDYINLLTSNCSQFKDNILSNLGNINYSFLQDYDTNTMGDSYLINSEFEMNQLTDEAEQKIIKHAVSVVRGNIHHELKKLGSQDLNVSVTSIHSILVPIYFINTSYQGKEYLFIMNGQTGDSIIDLPTSSSSIAVFSIASFVIIFLLVCIITYLM